MQVYVISIKPKTNFIGYFFIKEELFLPRFFSVSGRMLGFEIITDGRGYIHTLIAGCCLVVRNNVFVVETFFCLSAPLCD